MRFSPEQQVVSPDALGIPDAVRSDVSSSGRSSSLLERFRSLPRNRLVLAGILAASLLTRGRNTEAGEIIAPGETKEFFAEPDTDKDGCLDVDDCDDLNPNVSPKASENCTDGIDNDCDGKKDTADSDCAGPDSDGDGIADDSDNCPSVPNADQADLDIDGIGDACDDDKDGDGYTNTGGDCDDLNPAISPGASEKCTDGIDNDCDEMVDGSDSDCLQATETPSPEPSPSANPTPSPTPGVSPSGSPEPSSTPDPTNIGTTEPDPTQSPTENPNPQPTTEGDVAKSGGGGCGCETLPGQQQSGGAKTAEGLLAAAVATAALSRRKRREEVVE